MTFDAAILGAGVVGCAIVRRLALGGARCVLLENGADILSGASKGNSALLHTGFDAPPGSLELQSMRAGYAEYLQIRARLNLPLGISQLAYIGAGLSADGSVPPVAAPERTIVPSAALANDLHTRFDNAVERARGWRSD